jgi:hypothetical protein
VGNRGVSLLMKDIWKDPLVKKLLTPDQIASMQKTMSKMEAMDAEAKKRGLDPGRTPDERRRFALRMRDFSGYVLSFHPQERFGAFLEIVPQLTDPEYWEMVREVWMTQETIRPNERKWLELLQSPRACREALMSQAERTELAAMLDQIEIWRGCGTPSGVKGLSWTSRRKQADFFAEYACDARRRFMTGEAGTEPLVVSAVCRKADVLAYFTEREESEIVLDPDCLRSVTILRKGGAMR